uniref:Uncharacterized protein n=1 Tax=Magallana gigas TaxID=29159 RepID=K1QM76_MAGGI
MSMRPSTKIVKFMAPGSGVLALGKIIDVSPGETVEQQEYNDRAHQYGIKINMILSGSSKIRTSRPPLPNGMAAPQIVLSSAPVSLADIQLVPSDDYILVIACPNFTRLPWMVRLMILMHLTGLNAESEPYVSDAGYDAHDATSWMVLSLFVNMWNPRVLRGRFFLVSMKK